mmetsp:Transcript_24863/g.62967  ORF Transcript_24863/g.62967 Transcript_24863/m.62967 type:complete len:230 (-) Transcript_24863:2083-2772(-)
MCQCVSPPVPSRRVLLGFQLSLCFEFEILPERGCNGGADNHRGIGAGNIRLRIFDLAHRGNSCSARTLEPRCRCRRRRQGGAAGELSERLVEFLLHLLPRLSCSLHQKALCLLCPLQPLSQVRNLLRTHIRASTPSTSAHSLARADCLEVYARLVRPGVCESELRLERDDLVLVHGQHKNVCSGASPLISQALAILLNVRLELHGRLPLYRDHLRRLGRPLDRLVSLAP